MRLYEGKTGHVYDLAGNIDRFGRPEELVIEKRRATVELYSGQRLITGVPLVNL